MFQAYNQLETWFRFLQGLRGIVHFPQSIAKNLKAWQFIDNMRNFKLFANPRPCDVAT